MNNMKIIIVAGARPNFIKIAPLMEEIKKYQELETVLVHTGQHYDYEMSKVFFEGLNIPEPDYNFKIGSCLHGEQTGRIMIEFEKVCLKEKPDSVVVVGDVNSTLASALAAVKLHIPIAHIEAGCRYYDLKMPEEVNRVLTDHISKYLFCPTETAVQNLRKEGIIKGVYNTGDLMYDVFLKNVKTVEENSDILKILNLEPKKYYLATVHRAESTNNGDKLRNIVDVLLQIKNVVFPCHPRTEKYLKEYNLWEKLNSGIKVIKPLKYLDMLFLEKNAKKIITESGGVQKEAYWLNVPCITLLENTFWPETIKDGWNVLTGTDKLKIMAALALPNSGISQKNYFGNGDSAQKIIEILCRN